MPFPPPTQQAESSGLDRRSFLIGSGLFGAGTALSLAGCGRFGKPAAPPPQLVALFSTDHVIAAGQLQRLPFGLVDQGQPLIGEADDVKVEVHLNGEVIDQLDVSSRIVTHDHPEGNANSEHEHADILRYFAVRTTLPEPGIYDLIVEVDDYKISLPVQAFATEDVRVLLPGQPMPALDTPTFDDHRGIDPLCTRFPDPCPFHQKTLAELLQKKQPIAVLVSTPAVCATAYCGPVLEALIEVDQSFADVAKVHIEVYSNAREVNFGLNNENLRLAPAVVDLGLEFEPSLFLVNSDGIIVERIDNVYDQLELETALRVLS